MDRQTYYVSVQAKTIMMQQGDAAYEAEIRATPEEIEQLRSYFIALEEVDDSSAIRNMIPGIPYHHDSENDHYDAILQKIYALLSRLSAD